MENSNLFSIEEESIARVRNVLDDNRSNKKLLQAEIALLLENYTKLLKDNRFLIKLGDKQHRNLRESNGKLKQMAGELDLKNKKLEELSAQLSRYLPPQVYSMIFSGKHEAKIGVQRKKLTIFFSDIVNFTEITENLETETLVDALNFYLKEMYDTTQRHGGTFDKFVGDAILVFFGDPESGGEKADALACIRMALEMQEGIRGLQKWWYARGVLEPFQVRMGVHTGYCTVGNFGSEKCMAYTIIGNPVNLASRLEERAEPGQILISQATRDLVQDEIHCEKKEILLVKGIQQPVQSYAAVDFIENIPSPVNGQTTDILEKGEGYDLSIDFNKLSLSGRQQVIHSLEMAAQRLRNYSSSKVDK